MIKVEMTGEGKNFVCFVYWFNVKSISKRKNKLKKCHENYIIIVTKIRSVVLWQVAYIQKLRRE